MKSEKLRNTNGINVVGSMQCVMKNYVCGKK